MALQWSIDAKDLFFANNPKCSEKDLEGNKSFNYSIFSQEIKHRIKKFIIISIGYLWDKEANLAYIITIYNTRISGYDAHRNEASNRSGMVY